MTYGTKQASRDPRDIPPATQDVPAALEHLKLSSEAVQGSLLAMLDTPTLERADRALAELYGLSAAVQRIRLRLALAGGLE